ncbi:uncharacterized protein [Penaeus vannamei]|uniref:uncharacterized protein n=1 Tax=Penaeus vannamei TaxID=6689 RepID=UPI00387FAA81
MDLMSIPGVVPLLFRIAAIFLARCLCPSRSSAQTYEILEHLKVQHLGLQKTSKCRRHHGRRRRRGPWCLLGFCPGPDEPMQYNGFFGVARTCGARAPKKGTQNTRLNETYVWFPSPFMLDRQF